MASVARATASNQVRIIGGEWRRRLLRFPDVPGLRPTPDRVRETLFNWLGQRLNGQRCLDLFAGSGALGFEAASRGAGEVVLVEREGQALKALRENRALLGAEQIKVVAGEGLSFIAGDCGQFDVIFLDPPFAADLLQNALSRAATHLAPGGKIYIEFGSRPDLDGWQVLREGRAGASHFCLLERA
ncbi:MAG: 16S rRNA (guanine(966)-N(2))-methyltransferase RsmD [Parasulfuritortus sp.]|nr:16S rRNA (guanine(966)-N(2))-methyltransferase RsmD [Parasulfuritortus sp.]